VKNIKIGVRQEGSVEVTQGLAVNDEVITAGHMKVQEGMPVTSMPEESTTEKTSPEKTTPEKSLPEKSAG
jgi:hypothetical protein